MNQNRLQDLKEFLSIPSPSGFETEAAHYFRQRLKKHADSITVDVMGNSIAVLNAKAPLKVMLAGHYDEIGYQIIHIAENGLIYFRAVGGINKIAAPGTEVEILSEKGRIPGVICCKPIHFMDAAERERSPDLKSMWIDTGLSSKAEFLKKGGAVGDPISVRANVKELGSNRLMSKGMDDKIGAFIVSEVFHELHAKKKNLKVAVFAVGTVQEELGLRGAYPASFGINPQVGFCIDVGFTTDTPDIDVKQIGDLALGRGPILVRNADNNPVLGKHLRKIAKSKSIPFQETAGRLSSGGNDTCAMQLSRDGVATALISVPSRYMHSPVEMIDLGDVDHIIQLLVETILALKPTQTFRPGID